MDAAAVTGVTGDRTCSNPSIRRAWSGASIRRGGRVPGVPTVMVRGEAEDGISSRTPCSRRASNGGPIRRRRRSTGAIRPVRQPDVAGHRRARDEVIAAEIAVGPDCVALMGVVAVKVSRSSRLRPTDTPLRADALTRQLMLTRQDASRAKTCNGQAVSIACPLWRSWPCGSFDRASLQERPHASGHCACRVLRLCSRP